MTLRSATSACCSRRCCLTLLALLMIVGTSGCPGTSSGSESGSTCMDGKDNDNDGTIDCDDSDCKLLPLCAGSSDGGLDSRPPDANASFTDATPKNDQQLPQADRGSSPDLPPTSSYGSLCTFSGQIAPCPDGQTVCIPTHTGGAYCTYACNGFGSCPAGGPGTLTECSYGVNSITYCAFFCLWNGQPYDCPGPMGCLPDPAQPTLFGLCLPN